MMCPSLVLLLYFSLLSILSDIRIMRPTGSLVPFSWNTYFPFHFKVIPVFEGKMDFFYTAGRYILFLNVCLLVLLCWFPLKGRSVLVKLFYCLCF